MESCLCGDVKLADDSEVAEGFLTFHGRHWWSGKKQCRTERKTDMKVNILLHYNSDLCLMLCWYYI